MCRDCPWFERRESVPGSVTRLTTVASPLFSTSSYRPFLLQTAANQPVPVQHTPTPVCRRTAPKEPRLAVVARLLAELHVRLVYLPCRRLYRASFFRLSPYLLYISSTSTFPLFLLRWSWCVASGRMDGFFFFFFFFESVFGLVTRSNVSRARFGLERFGKYHFFNENRSMDL